MSSHLKKRLASLASFPAVAALKHFGDSLGEAIKVTANRKHIPHTNTVISPSTSYISGIYHFVSGRAWNVIAGPRTKSGRPAFLTAEDKGRQVDKFQKDGVGHREGPANALAPYVKPVTALTVRRQSSASKQFPKL